MPEREYNAKNERTESAMRNKTHACHSIHQKRNLLSSICLLTMLLSATTFLHATEVTAETSRLEKAWEEYSFQNWEKSGDLFTAVLGSNVDNAQKTEAKIGLIFIQQYRAPGRDPEAAIEAYEQLMKELAADAPIRPFILLNLGYAYATIDKPQIRKARETYQQGLQQTQNRKSFVAQQLTLRLLESYLRIPDSEGVQKGLTLALQAAADFKGTPSEGLAHSFAAQFAFLCGQTQIGVEQLSAQYYCGIVSRSIKESVLFRIARTCETELKDYPKAAKFYEIFSREIPTSSKAYFCNVRAKELRAGIIDSAIFKGSIMKQREKEQAAEKAANVQLQQ